MCLEDRREEGDIVPRAVLVADDVQALVTRGPGGPALTGQTLELGAVVKAAALS